MYTLPIYCLHWNIKWIIKIVISEGIKGTRYTQSIHLQDLDSVDYIRRILLQHRPRHVTYQNRFVGKSTTRNQTTKG